MNSETLSVCVLAAGKGTRMGGDVPKVLVPLEGTPLLGYVLSAITEAGIDSKRVVVVAGHKYEEVVEFLDGRFPWVLQEQQLGTGHALLSAREKLEGLNGTVMVLYGDVPLITREVIEGLYRDHTDSGSVCSVLTTDLDDPTGYGRIVRGDDGTMLGIVEEKEADERIRAIREINTGLYCFEIGDLFSALEQVGNNNSKGEYYLTDVVRIFIDQDKPVNAVRTEDCSRVLGINTFEELDEAASVIKGNA